MGTVSRIKDSDSAPRSGHKLKSLVAVLAAASLVLSGGGPLESIFELFGAGRTTVHADGAVALQLGTAGIADGHHIYYGTKTDDYNYWDPNGGTDPYWRVLDADQDNTGAADGMFVLSETLWGNKPNTSTYEWVSFDSSSNIWQYSEAEEWCVSFTGRVFSLGEGCAVRTVVKADAAEDIYGLSWGTGRLYHYVFFLSAKEASIYLAENCETVENKDRLKAYYNGSPQNWWLRSHKTGTSDEAGYVLGEGAVNTIDIPLRW